VISAAEQQFVIKLQDTEELAKRFVNDVLGHARLTSSSPVYQLARPNDVLDPRNVLSVIKHLNVEVRTDFGDGIWNIDMGGAQTKKKVKLSVANLDIGLAKALIIYVRKYL
jgi:hypothetical protein